ncbi:MAG: 4Fe-4S dicluster domain-containing protein [Bacillota bacterium]
MATDLSLAISKEVAGRIREISGQNPNLCMQCGTCSASCTGIGKMDFLPRQVLRKLQLGDPGVLQCRSIWVCTACLTCTARCPRGIDIARLMEALRAINLRKGNEVLVLEKIPPELIKEVPQMALTSGFRKLSA